MVYEKNISIDEQVVVVKITARCTKAAKYIACLIYINKYQHKLIDIALQISDNSDFLTEASISKNWVKIQRSIRDAEKASSGSSQDITNTLIENLKSILIDENIDILLLSASYLNKMSVIKLIDFIIQKTINDPHPMFDVDFDNCFLMDLELEKKEYDEGIVTEVIEEAEEEEKINEEEKIEETKATEEEITYTMIDSVFIVSPISGIPVSSVLIGEKIMVKISNKTQAERNVLFAIRGIKSNDGKFVVPAEVIQNYVSKKTGTPILIVKLMDGIYSKIEDFEPVKILMYKDEEVNRDKQKGHLPKWMFNILIFLSLWTLALAILALLFFR